MPRRREQALLVQPSLDHAALNLSLSGGATHPLLIEANTMALETAVTINQLDPANPSGPDRLAQGDDHIRLIKSVLKNTFPNINAPVTVTDEQLNAPAFSIPLGLISLWYGSSASIPAGYALCDGGLYAKTDGSGNINTPDLRGRAVVGASADHAQGSTFGAESHTVTTDVQGAHDHAATIAPGGGHNHVVAITPTALTIAQIPAHTHSTPCGSSEGDNPSNFTNGGGAAGSAVSTSSVGGSEAHTHTGEATAVADHAHAATIGGVAGHAHGITVDVVQPSIALHYIMKV